MGRDSRLILSCEGSRRDSSVQRKLCLTSLVIIEVRDSVGNEFSLIRDFGNKEI